MMFKKSFIPLFFVLFVYSTFSQTDTTVQQPVKRIFQTEKMSDDKKIPDEAKNMLNKADKLVQKSPNKYKKAVELYRKAYQTNPDNALLNFRMGLGFLKCTGSKAKSIMYIEKAYHQDNRVDEKIHYYLGESYHLNFNIEGAIKEYETYIEEFKKKNTSLTPEELQVLLREVYKKLEECKNALELKNNPVRVFIDNLGDSINTIFSEYDPFMSADETEIIFTARREDTRGGGSAELDATYYEDIYIANNENGIWSKASNMSNRMNKKTNDAIIGLSFNGQKMFVYRDTDNGDIYLSKRKGKNWSVPKKLKAICSPYHESSACFSPDEKTIYFVSDRPNGFGGRDIYKSTVEKKRKWSTPVLLNETINTPYDEDRVYMHPDGKSFFFSSQGHASMGGYDIFKTTLLNDSTWSTPENLGYPINSVDDDISFVQSPNGKYGYYASISPAGKGGKDIYKITFLGPEKEGVINTSDNLLAGMEKPQTEIVIEPKVQVRKNEITILKGVIRDAITLDSIEASIEIVDNEMNTVINTFLSSSTTGKYVISLPSGKNYGIAVKAEGYLFHSENIIIPASTNYQVVEKNIDLKKIDVGSKIVLKNIFFDFDKATIRSESYAELERLTQLLNEFTNIRIEISGHTDNIGTTEYNQQLSEKRAQSVVNYLIEKGITAERLEFAGYGFNQPIAANDTEEGRQLNRRTEFKVLSTDYNDPNKKFNLSKFNPKLLLNKLSSSGQSER